MKCVYSVKTRPMKITLLYVPKVKIKICLCIERRYKSNREIIPIGSDCHPAYTLQKMNLRKYSLPFDWLLTNSVKGLKLVSDNIKSDFKYFLSDLYENERGRVVSKKYPFTEFYHEKYLIENPDSILKFTRRISRFKKKLDEEVYFLYCVNSNSLKSNSLTKELYESVIEFSSLLKSNQLLLIYIRYDESLNENRNNCQRILRKVKSLENVRIVNYIREKKKEGIWGNEKHYPLLYKALGIKLSQTFPKLSIEYNH